MTGQQMIDKIKLYYPRSGSILADTQIMEFINTAMDEIYKDINTVAKYTFKTVENTYLYALPSYIDFDNITKLELTTDTTVTKDSYWKEYELSEEYTQNVNLTNYKYYNAFSDIGIYPIPTVTDQSVNIYYKIKPNKYINMTATFANATDIITAAGHGLINGTAVKSVNSGGALPTGLSATTYYVITATTDTFKISLTSGGAAVDFTTDGAGTNTVNTLSNECNLKVRFHMLIVYNSIMEITTIGDNPDIDIYNMYQVKFNAMLNEARMDKKPTKTKAARWW